MTELNSGIILKAIVIIHFVLTVWASMSPMFPASYIYCHAAVLILGVLSVLNQESASHVLMFLTFTVISVPLDVIFLSIFQPAARDLFEYRGTVAARNLYRFSLGMSILNLLFKPLTSLIAFRIYQERGGTYSNLSFPGLPNLGTGTRGGEYDNIDQPVPNNQVETAVPHQSFDKPPVFAEP